MVAIGRTGEERDDSSHQAGTSLRPAWQQSRCGSRPSLGPTPAAALAVVCGGREVCGARYGIDRRDFPVTLDRAEGTVIGLR
jgi:hypothetical protein